MNLSDQNDIDHRLRPRGRGVFGWWWLGLFWLPGCENKSSTATTPVVTSSTVNVGKAITSAEDEALLRKLCTQCHLFVEPSVLPKSEWDSVAGRMAQMPGYGRTIPKRLDTTAVMQWFRERAPETLVLTDRTRLPLEPPPLKRTTLGPPRTGDVPFVSQVQFVTWPESGERRLLTCDMRTGMLCETTRDGGSLSLRVFCDQVPHAVRQVLVDLDRDGQTDLVVANLGSFVAMDHNLGTVDWLRRNGEGWERVILAENLGRVADLKPFDFDGDGDLDLAVAEFGWRLTGHVLLLENTTRKTGQSRELTFTPRTLDERHGAEQIEITDLDGNGRPDVIALLSQEHEVLVAYLNQPDGTFQMRELHRAPHSVWGYSGFQLLDFDGDGDLDVLITNGDMLDGPTIKPYHGIAWLENLGALKFVEHPLAELPGAHRAEAADLDGDGDLDIVACTLVPAGTDQQAERQGGALPPALIWLEQTAPREFQFHVWERGPGRYPTLTTGDFDGDGKADVALGVGFWDKRRSGSLATPYVELWTSGTK